MKFNSRVTKQPRKQRWARYNADLHEKRALIFIHVAGDLAKKIRMNSVQPRKGEKVKIMRGKFAGTQGKIIDVDVKRMRLHVEGAVVKKMNGKEEFMPIHPSKVVLLETTRTFEPKKAVLVKDAAKPAVLVKDVTTAKTSTVKTTAPSVKPATPAAKPSTPTHASTAKPIPATATK